MGFVLYYKGSACDHNGNRKALSTILDNYDISR